MASSLVTQNRGNIVVTNNDQVRVTVTGVDDQLVVLVDDILSTIVHFGDTDQIEVMDLIRNKPGAHYLNLVGINRGGPWQFSFRIDVNGNTVPGLDIATPPGPETVGYVWSWSLQIVLQ